MAKKVISPAIAVRIVLFHAGFSIACLLLFALLGSVDSIRVYVGAAGCVTGIIASGEGVWMSIRLRDVRCSLATVCALVALALWAWLLYLRIYGHFA